MTHYREHDELIESPDIDKSVSNDATSIKHVQKMTSLGDEEKSNTGDDMLADSDEDDTLKSSGNWKYSMFSQESNNDDDGEEDQLLPDDEAEETTTEESRRVPTLSVWLGSAGQQGTAPSIPSNVAKEQDMTLQPSSNTRNQHVQKPVRLRASSVESSYNQPTQDIHQRRQSVPPFESNDMDWQLERSYARSTTPAQSHQWVSSNFLNAPSLERPSSSSVTAKKQPSRKQQPTLYEMFRPRPPFAEKQSRQTLSQPCRSSSSNTTTPSISTTTTSSSTLPKASHQHIQVTTNSNIEQVSNTHPSSQSTLHQSSMSNSAIPTPRASSSPSDMMRKRQRLIHFDDEQQQHDQTLTDTLNIESNVLCNKEEILKTYHLRFAGLSGLERRSFGDPPPFSSQPSDHDTDWHIHHLDQGFVLYTRNAKHQDALGDVAYEIGIVDLAR